MVGSTVGMSLRYTGREQKERQCCLFCLDESISLVLVFRFLDPTGAPPADHGPDGSRRQACRYQQV